MKCRSFEGAIIVNGHQSMHSLAMRPTRIVKNSVNRDLKLLRRLLRAKDHMDAAPQEDWPISRLASVSGASEAYFARSFRDAFGIPPHRYLLTRRVERAAALLRDTDTPIIEIALQTGWNSLGTFGRTFRDVTGESPSELRRRMQLVPGDLEEVPHCFVSAAQRPHLKMAVSEKRRRTKEGRHDGRKGDDS